MAIIFGKTKEKSVSHQPEAGDDNARRVARDWKESCEEIWKGLERDLQESCEESCEEI